MLPRFLKNKMKMFTALICLLWGLVPVFAEPEPRYNILKGMHKTHLLSSSKIPKFELCTFEDVKLIANVATTDLLNKQNAILQIEAMDIKEKISLSSYEVENYVTSPNENESQVKAKIVSDKVCDSFKVEKRVIKSEQYFFIKFYNDGKWKCDVYIGYTFRYKKTDECSELGRDYEALEDPIYYSADMAKKEFLTPRWTACPDKTPVTLCTFDTHFKVGASFFCNNGKTIYRIFAYYNGVQMGTYMISNSQSLVGEIDGDKVCKLFRFQRDGAKTERVFVRYYKEGQWKCQTWKFLQRVYTTRYIIIRGFGECGQY